LILRLDAAQASVALVGGKGANLARLARAGFPVPKGFLVTTQAYAAYVAANTLGEWVATTAAGASSDPTSLEAASQAIRARFAVELLPRDIAAILCAAYETLGRPPVAVRSSATAEDLPDLSFAGQQDTYLNIIGDDALLRAVVACWGSLWTARAIGYRARNDISQHGLALGVVVQEMVQSEASGVLFTANPLTGLRIEAVIDATLGLGEALVSGQVEPDQYLVDTVERRVLRKSLGAKSLSIRSNASGGTLQVAEDASQRQALPDEHILALADMGCRVAELYGAPQDIEWAWTEGRLSLLQSRAITSLYPLPEDVPSDPLQVLLSFGAVQGMLDPMTPLGRDVLQGIVVPVAPHFGVHVTHETQRVLVEAGERLFINFTTFTRNRVGRKVLQAALPSVEPGGGQTLEALWADPQSGQPGPVRLRTVVQLVRGFLPIVAQVLRNWANPQAAHSTLQRIDAAVMSDFAAHSAAAKTLAECLALFDTADKYFPRSILPHFLPAVISGIAAFQVLTRMTTDVPDSTRIVMELTRGLPHNVTTEMDMVLWATAQGIRADPASKAYFASVDAETLANDWLAQRLPPVAQTLVEDFLNRYGMRGLAEIDLGRARWREDPTSVFQVLQSYLTVTDPAQAPDVVYARGAAAAEASAEQLIATVRQKRGGWLRARLVRFVISRMRALMGLRESPKFFAIRLMGMIRQALLRSGAGLAADGVLARPDDVFFLRQAELDALAMGEKRDWQALVAERRRVYAREMRRRQVPRLLLSDGRAFFQGLGADSGAADLVGSPVSPGIVEGAVHVVLNPHGAQLAPGEILVCPGTDPAWTPLFLAAGGLVMEVGGMMTHGAVVAREYGIPAVVGVHQATTRLQTGQRIRVNGSTGQIEVLGAVT